MYVEGSGRGRREGREWEGRGRARGETGGERRSGKGREGERRDKVERYIEKRGEERGCEHC